MRLSSGVQQEGEMATNPKVQKLPLEIWNGPTIDVIGKDLAKRLDLRVRWHDKRAENARTEFRQLVAAAKAAERPTDWQARDCQRHLREHEEKSQFLAFVRDYLVVDVTYRLTKSELRLLDLVPESA
jgi:hypothetical protein